MSFWFRVSGFKSTNCEARYMEIFVKRNISRLAAALGF